VRNEKESLSNQLKILEKYENQLVKRSSELIKKDTTSIKVENAVDP
jgi:hypothetical protein